MLQPSTATSFHIHQKENNLLLLHLPLLLDKCDASGPPQNLIRPDTVKMQKRDTTRWTEQLCLYKHSLSYSNFISSSNYVTIRFTSEQKKMRRNSRRMNHGKLLERLNQDFFRCSQYALCHFSHLPQLIVFLHHAESHCKSSACHQQNHRKRNPTRHPFPLRKIWLVNMGTTV